MLANIKDHSLVVARIAEFLAVGLEKKGFAIPVELTISAALLHDIAKSLCLHNDENHASKGREICLEHGFHEIASIVEEHVILGQAFPDLPLSAKEIVYYADKRVNHDQIVSLSARLAYILERYGRGDKNRCQAIQQNFQRCLVIEKELFSHLQCTPSELAEEIENSPGKVDIFFADYAKT